MSKWQLPEVDLHEYVEKVKKVFGIEAEGKIEYSEIFSIPKEIDRRRTLLKYFIPDIFVPGKYNRRADLIDGCIYYLEFLEEKGNQSIVYSLWTKRLRIKKEYNAEDLEEDIYGYNLYHPIWSVLGNPNNPGLFITNLVKNIHAFKGRKRKLDINDYSLIFFDIFHSIPFSKITKKMLNFLQLLSREFERRPLKEAINLKTFMKSQGFGDVRSFLAQFNKLGIHIHPLYERSNFGLDTYVFYCPFPNHVQIKFKQKYIGQEFLTGGKEFIQEIFLILPSNERWKLLYRKFPPQTRCYRLILLQVPNHSFLDYFNLAQQKWNIPWTVIKENWSEYFENLNKMNNPIQLGYKRIVPTENLLKVCELLERDGNVKNKIIHRKTKIPIQEIEKIRTELDVNTLVTRVVLLFHANLIDYSSITLPGREDWKYQLLLKLGEVAPYFMIFYLEDKTNSKFYLRANYLMVPEDGLNFLRTFTKIFHGQLDYSLHKTLFQARFGRSWFQDYFDSKTKRLVWDPNDFEIKPLSFKKK